MTMANEQLIFDLGLDATQGFVEGIANENARNALAVSSKLIVIGAPRSGKSSLAKLASSRHGARIVQSVADVDQVITSDSHGDIVIDDVEQFLKINGAEKALFHLFNYATNQSLGLKLFSAQSPMDWSIDLPDLRSRIDIMPQVEIGAPDDAMVGILLAQGFHARGVLVSPELVEYVAKRVERSYKAIENVIIALDIHARRSQSKVSRGLAKSYFEDLI